MVLPELDPLDMLEKKILGNKRGAHVYSLSPGRHYYSIPFAPPQRWNRLQTLFGQEEKAREEHGASSQDGQHDHCQAVKFLLVQWAIWRSFPSSAPSLKPTRNSERLMRADPY